MLKAQYETQYKLEIDHWWYRVRRELVRDIFYRYVKGKQLKILDVGCGTGALMKELGSYGDVYGLDFSEDAIEYCRERGEKNLTIGSINSIPFESGYFDAVVALDVIEHVQDDVGAIAEIKRVLKPGGICLIFVPAFKILWGKADELGCHFRRYRLPELEDKISRTGLIVKKSSYFNFMLFLPILAVRLIVRLFRIKVGNEGEVGSRFMGNILYNIFRSEISILRYVDLPFGVSALVISNKT